MLSLVGALFFTSVDANANVSKVQGMEVVSSTGEGVIIKTTTTTTTTVNPDGTTTTTTTTTTTVVVVH